MIQTAAMDCDTVLRDASRLNRIWLIDLMARLHSRRKTVSPTWRKASLPQFRISVYLQWKYVCNHIYLFSRWPGVYCGPTVSLSAFVILDCLSPATLGCHHSVHEYIITIKTDTTPPLIKLQPSKAMKPFHKESRAQLSHYRVTLAWQPSRRGKSQSYACPVKPKRAKAYLN